MQSAGEAGRRGCAAAASGPLHIWNMELFLEVSKKWTSSPHIQRVDPKCSPSSRPTHSYACLSADGGPRGAV